MTLWYHNEKTKGLTEGDTSSLKKHFWRNQRIEVRTASCQHHVTTVFLHTWCMKKQRVWPSSLTYLPVSPCRSFRCESVLRSGAERRRRRLVTEEAQLLPLSEPETHSWGSSHSYLNDQTSGYNLQNKSRKLYNFKNIHVHHWCREHKNPDLGDV